MIREQPDEENQQIIHVEAILVEEAGNEEQKNPDNILYVDNATVLRTTHKQIIYNRQSMACKFITCMVLLLLVLVVGSYFT